MTSPETQTTRERLAFAFAASLTALGLYLVPSWDDALDDPGRQAFIAAAATIVLLFITRSLGPKAFTAERVISAAFLAAMPMVYLARWFTTGGGGAAPVWLGVEVAGLVIYSALAILGFYRSPWFLAAGIAAHGLAWDAWHLHSTYIPAWYAVGCLVIDIGLSAYVAVRIAAWRERASLLAL